MKFHKLRIAWSVVWGLIAVLLIVLWVRSYRVFDVFSFYDSNGRSSVLGSNAGTIFLQRRQFFAPGFPGHSFWSFVSHAPFESRSHFEATISTSVLGLRVPTCFPTLAAAALATLPWIRQLRWRFSLRTLLIATTLIAVVLGLVVWAAEK